MARAGRTRRRRRGRLLRWLPLAAFALIALLYYRPVRSYLETRGALAARQAEVRRLRGQHQALAHRLALLTSDRTLLREARRLSYVKPGERLFVVKGIGAWERKRARLDESRRNADKR
jgi:cell division protein FtsB